jgi:hypothetical protein
MNIIHYLIISSFLCLGACATRPPEQEPVRYPAESPKITTVEPQEQDVTARMLANELGSDLYTEMEFEEGSVYVSDLAEAEIRALYQKASERADEIRAVHLISWADKEYPDEQQEELHEEQVDLADERNNELEKIVRNIDEDISVSKISMADRPTGWAELTSTKSAEIKESLELQEPHGKESHSIVVFIPEN